MKRCERSTRLAILALGAALAALSVAAAAASTAGGRTVLGLDGDWRIAQGSMEAPTEGYTRTVPVPGLADMAKPAFDEVGVASGQRQAFWYRRSFAVPGPARAAAVLKLAKARFGTKVWVNGREVGEHWGCSTPVSFDVTAALAWGADNEIVVRVGASKESLPAWVPYNTDYEKARWIPGIYDAVTLSLMDAPWVSSVQVASEIAAGRARVEVELTNPGPTAAQTRLRLTVREWRGGQAAGAPVVRQVLVPAGGSARVRTSVKLNSPRLWSPEDPFLYVLRADAGADAVEARFGMRDLRFDPRSGRAILNGRPYYLRGTDFCMYRFFEDPIRGGLPWDRAWVRRLLELPRKGLHWNSARVCIAPLPEFWYDIADETGWLLQDEFPIWGFDDAWGQEELEREFGEWVRERWNHPSVVVWDACNETLTPRTGALIGRTRPLDLSDRPWDDGYTPRHRPSDPMEIHPYQFLGQGRRWEPSDLGSVFDRAIGLTTPPFVINEYDAMWLQRDGTPATGYAGYFDAMLGPTATPDQRRELLAYTGAALTEYWRARREAAAVQWFCYLTYSRPGAVTGDNFTDLRRLVLEPHFLDYMSNAFAPLGVLLDDCPGWAPAGSEARQTVVLTNDLRIPMRGVVRLTLRREEGGPGGPRPVGGPVAGATAPFRVDALGQTAVVLKVSLPAAAGAYLLAAEARPAGRLPVVSRRKLRLVTADEARRLVSLAEGKLVLASSEITDTRGYCPARFVNDGKLSTRWSSEFSDPQWLRVDLGEERTVGRVVLVWEAAYGKAYRIQVSGNGQDWRDVYTTEAGRGGREEMTFAPTKARYVRFCGEKRSADWGYSLWEMQVFEH